MSWFYNLSIAKKIRTGFIFIITLAILIGLYSTISMNLIAKETQKMYNNPYTSVKSILTIKSDITKLHSLMQEVAASMDIENIERIADEIESCESRLFQEFKVFGNSYTGNVEDFNQLKLAFIDSRPIRQEILNLSKADMRDIATDITNNQEMQSVNELNEIIAKLLAYSQDSAEEFVVAAKKASDSVIIVNVCAILFLLVVAIIVSRKTTKSIVNPIKKIEIAAGNLSRGELFANLDNFYDDEIGVLAGSISETIYILNSYVGEISQILTKMADGDMVVTVEGDYKGSFLPIKNALNTISSSLNQTLHSINTAAETVADSAHHVNDQASTLLHSVGEQVKGTDQLKALMTDISMQSKQNEKSAGAANTLATQIKDSAQVGADKMQGMLDSMDKIKQSSDDIAKIVKVIEDIAFQTTVLSLNASIEAAAAGVHGRGFAVVAEQVRDLASRSSAAATEARTLVTDSIAKSYQGSTDANETAAALEYIISGVNDTVTLIDRIFKASNQQTELIENAVTVVADINTVVSNSEESAKQSAQESRILTDQAVLLKSRINRFNLKKAEYAEKTNEEGGL